MTKKGLILFFLMLFTCSCSVYHITSEGTTNEYYPSKEIAEDVVYVKNVNQPHEVIAHITVNTERRQKLGDIIAKMKREAAILGADAITDIKSDATGRWKKLPAQDLIGNAYVRANFTVSAVVFK